MMRVRGGAHHDAIRRITLCRAGEFFAKPGTRSRCPCVPSSSRMDRQRFYGCIGSEIHGICVNKQREFASPCDVDLQMMSPPAFMVERLDFRTFLADFIS